jgi:hypothetical protein
MSFDRAVVGVEPAGDAIRHSGRPASRSRWSRLEVAAAIGIVLTMTGALIWLPVSEASWGDDAQPFAVLRIIQYEPEFVFSVRKLDAMRKFDQFRRLQAKLVRSPLVLQAALIQPEVLALDVVSREPAPAAFLEESIQVELYGVIGLRVSIHGVEGADAATLINAVVDAYISEVVIQDRKKLEARIELARKVERECVDTLRSQERKLRSSLELPDAHDVEALQAKVNVQRELLTLVRNEIRKLEIEIEHWIPRISVIQRATFPVRRMPDG